MAATTTHVPVLTPAKRSHGDVHGAAPDEPALKRSSSSDDFKAHSEAPSFKDQPDLDSACDYVLDVIHSRALAKADADRVMRDVIGAWADHVNPG